MVKLIAVPAFVLFVAWGATTRPGRPFSWTMYSGSSKAFLWTDATSDPRVPSYEELRLAPDSHYLTLADLERLHAQAPHPRALEGLILGSRGSWLVKTDGEGTPVVSSPVPPGEDVGALITLVTRLGCRRP